MDNATDRPRTSRASTSVSPRSAQRARAARPRLADGSGRASQRPLLRANRGEEAVELSFAQQRLWLLDRLLPMGSVYNMPRSAAAVGGARCRRRCADALNEVVRRHEALRTRFGCEDRAPVQVIAPELAVALEVEDLRDCAPAERAGGGAAAGAGGGAGAVRSGARAAAAGAAAAAGEPPSTGCC